ncbi:hypothetical protein [Flavobacterium sp.]|uniref:hypothetical protein n=1 Tax=Flavobacterium sp. TaxID=239 RepID=UPI0025C5662E|nr:hypothetical protein [Flavobacterium sp.]
MRKESLRIYSLNILNLFLISFIIEIFFTIIANYPNKNSSFTGITFWLIFTFYLVIKILKKTKTHLNKFLVAFFISLIILFLIRNKFNIFNFIEPNYFGFNGHLFNYNFKSDNYDVKKFLFWQTGVCCNYNLVDFYVNPIFAFFTLPPIAILECLIKSIFPDIFILFLIQIPFIFLNKKYTTWTNNLS